MRDDVKQQSEWRSRFEAVARAQGRYLNLLLISALFFIALGEQRQWDVLAPSDQELPLLGVKLSGGTLLIAGPTVLGFLLLAALGTFPALKLAYECATSGSAEWRLFERFDSSPTAIDFITYVPPSHENRWYSKFGLLAYPIALILAYFEAVVLEVIGFKAWFSLALSQRALLVLGAVLLLWAFPRLIGVTILKIRMLLSRTKER